MIDPSEWTFAMKVKALRNLVTCTEVADLLELDVGRDGKTRSPFNPGERTPSCHIYEDHWFDYATGKGGDVIDLVLAFGEWDEDTPDEKRFVDAVKRLWRFANSDDRDLDITAVERVKVETPLPVFDLPGRPVSVSDFVAIPANSRGFGFGCTSDGGTLYIPHRLHGVTYGVKTRDFITGAKGALTGSQFGRHLYWPLGVLPACPRAVVICEGESDSWAMTSFIAEQAPTSPSLWVWACSLPSGAGSWNDKYLAEIPEGAEVYVCMDNDKAGHDARAKIDRAFQWSCKGLFVPQLYNDAREALNAGWKPKL